MNRFQSKDTRLTFLFTILFLLVLSGIAIPQSDPVTKAVETAALGYIEGFYEGDPSKLTATLKPTLHKFGYWKNKDTGKYEPDGFMTYGQAIDYAKSVSEKKNFPKPDAPKSAEVLNLTNKIAVAKITAWWGVDYVLLSKDDENKWLIEQVLWEGPTIESTSTDADRQGVSMAALDYLEGFYEGDSSRLKQSLKPTLFKYGYGIDKESGKYYEGGRMTYEQAIGYADRVKETKKFPNADAPKKVEVIDVMNHIALAKVTAWWGVDYILLAKSDEKWMIEQVLWAGLQ